MTPEKPVLYLVHGDDAHAMQAFVHTLLERMGDDPGLVDMNVARFDGRNARLDDISTAAQAMPFLAERRLVIVEYPLSADSSKTGDKWKNLLSALPPTTALVLVVTDEMERGKWSKLKPEHWLNKFIAQAGPRAYVQECRQPAQSAMPGWIANHAKKLGGQIEKPAADLLAEYIGSDTALAALELDKLLTYVDYARPVDRQDVQDLTPVGSQVTVFDLVDQMAARDRKTALHTLESLLNEQDVWALFPMVVRQFRLLICARELIDEGRRAAELQSYGVNSFHLEKMMKLAGRFTLAELVGIYERLVAAEEAAKTGGMGVDLALETLIAEM